MPRVTDYLVFMLIMGACSVVALAASLFHALRSGRTLVGEPPHGLSALRERRPVLFWTNVSAQVLGAVGILTGMIIAVVRRYAE